MSAEVEILQVADTTADVLYDEVDRPGVMGKINSRQRQKQQQQQQQNSNSNFDEVPSYIPQKEQKDVQTNAISDHTDSQNHTQHNKNTCMDQVPSYTTENGSKHMQQHTAITNGSNITDSNTTGSISVFTEQYDTLDVTDYPHPNPGAQPGNESRHLDDLDVTDFPIMGRSKSKVKTLVRQKKKIEGISTSHVTYFPPKRGEDYHNYTSEVSPMNSRHLYKMGTFPRGIMIVFNMEYFMENTGMAGFPRKGTERDADGLCALFLELGFIVERVDNATRQMVDEVCTRVVSEGSQVSCVACTVLTHGEEERLYAIDGPIQIKHLTKLFRAKSLAGKPKLFLFQACRGSDYMDALDATDAPPSQLENEDVALPCEADFFYAYSTVPGYYSWRNSRNGSWFMQSVCSVFRQYAHDTDVYRMLTRVNHQVSSRKSRTDDAATDDKRQIASLVSQLRKELFFFPPYGALASVNTSMTNVFPGSSEKGAKGTG